MAPAQSAAAGEVAVGDDVSVVVMIRPASVDDADAVGEVHVRAWQSAYRGVMPDAYLDGLQARDHATRWRNHLIAPSSEGELIVVVDDHRVVGFASVGPTLDRDAPSDIGQLYAINLDPDVWGRGLGRALLSVATDRLSELGYLEAVLWVVPDNQRARRLYESEGWGDDDCRRDDEVFGVVVSQMRYRRLLVEPSASQPGRPDSASGYPTSGILDRRDEGARRS
jgi:ribosomal protein S18 acetylase RimI-like enzyme